MIHGCRSPVIVRDVPVTLKRFSLVAAAAPSMVPNFGVRVAAPVSPFRSALAGSAANVARSPGRRNRQNHFNFKCQQLTQSQYHVEKFK